MKPGDRVRVIRGPREGRFGIVVDIKEVAARRAAVEEILKPSETRTLLLARLHVPPGCVAVQVDPIKEKSGNLGIFQVSYLDRAEVSQ